MRTNERKGAWTLLIGVLLFGALVWGLGGRQMREDRARETTGQPEVVTLASDSTADTDGSVNGKRARRARRSRASKSSSRSNKSASNKSASSAPPRDILADTITSRSH